MSKSSLKFSFSYVLQKLCLLKGQHIYALSVACCTYGLTRIAQLLKEGEKRGTHRPARKSEYRSIDYAAYAAVRSGIHNIIIGSQIETNREQSISLEGMDDCLATLVP